MRCLQVLANAKKAQKTTPALLKVEQRNIQSFIRYIPTNFFLKGI